MLFKEIVESILRTAGEFPTFHWQTVFLFKDASSPYFVHARSVQSLSASSPQFALARHPHFSSRHTGVRVQCLLLET